MKEQLEKVQKKLKEYVDDSKTGMFDIGFKCGINTALDLLDNIDDDEIDAENIDELINYTFSDKLSQIATYPSNVVAELMKEAYMLCKQQMLKEAVEGVRGENIMQKLDAYLNGHTIDGDTVKIIVVKE